MEDLTGKTNVGSPPDTQLAHTEWNPFAQEFKNLIETDAGLTMSVADARQLAKAIVQVSSAFGFFTGGGTGNAQTLTVIGGRPGPTAYVAGLRVRWLPSAGNTGPTTVNVNSIGVVALLREDGTPLQSGDLSTSRTAEAYHNGTNFRLLNSSLGAPAQALPNRFIAGLNFLPSAADMTHDVTFAAGSARDATNSANLVLNSALTKRFDGASIALGTGQTGFPTASLTRAAATWYRVFIVGHVDGRVDFGFDTLLNAANLRADLVTIDAAGWVFYRQLGWVRTQAADANAFVPFVQYAEAPGVFQWVAHDTRFDPFGALVTSRTLRTISSLCPPDGVAELVVSILDTSGSGTSERYAILADTDQADTAPSNVAHSVGFMSRPGDSSPRTALVRVNGSSQFYERWNSAGEMERTIYVPRWRFAR